MKGQPGIIMNYHKDYAGCCVEFKNPTINYQVSNAQREVKRQYKENNYYLLLSNDYDLITRCIKDYMEGVRVPCKYCNQKFLSKENRATHYKIIHRTEK